MFNLYKFKALFRLPVLPPFERAVADLDAGRHAEALVQFETLLAAENLTPAERAKVANKRGIALVKLGRRDEALQAFQNVLDAMPRYAPSLVNVGNLCLEDGSIDDAVMHYEAAIRADDEYPVAHLNLGVALKHLGRTSESVRELKKASRLEGRLLTKRRK